MAYVLLGEMTTEEYVESYLENTIKLLHESDTSLHPLNYLICDIYDTILAPAEVIWKQLQHKENRRADRLANESLDILAQCKIFNVLPTFLSQLVLEDI